MDQREVWARRICEAGGPGRYLLPGSDLAFIPNFDDDDLDLRAFLERVDGDEDGSLLASAYWLAQPVLLTFMQRDLPSLLKSLGHASRRLPPTTEAVIRGSVLWQPTYAGRYSGAVPRGRYVIAETTRTSDIPENQLLRWFLVQVRTAASRAMRKGQGALPVRYTTLFDISTKALGHPHLQSVTSHPKPTARMWQTASRNKDLRYGTMAQLAASYEKMVRQGMWEPLLDMLRSGWLAPVTSENLFELYVLVLVLRIVEVELAMGEPVRYGLIQAGRSSVAMFATGAVEIEVFFDQVPSTIFKTGSAYLATASRHVGITVQERRPDIFVVARDASGERRVLIEVKESGDAKYIRGSLYKVMAYLRDFESVWEGDPGQASKAILVFPSGIGRKDPCEVSEITMVAADDDGLARALAQALQVPATVNE